MDNYRLFSWFEKVPPVYRLGGVFTGYLAILGMYKT